MFGFPVPVSNQSIPRGWFAALVRFMNSLLLRGDGRYFAVTHTTEGTTIKPTPALIQALERSGGAAPAAGGGASGLVATVSGNTASVAVSGSSPLPIVAGQNVAITGGMNGEVIIGAGSSSLPGIFTTSSGSHTVTENTWYLAQSDGLLFVGYYLALAGETSYSIYYYLDVATADPNNLSSYTNEENLIARTVTSLSINAPTTSLFVPIKYNQKFRILAKKNGLLYENGAIYGKFYGTFTETTLT